MGLLTPGYWHSTYWPKDYWADDYWQDYSGAALTLRAQIVAAVDACFNAIVHSAAVDSVRQRIADNADTLFQTILISGGFKSDLGMNVFDWKTTAIQQADLPALVYRDIREEQALNEFAKMDRDLYFEVHLLTNSATPAATVREMIADVEKAIMSDPTWGGLGIMTFIESNEVEIEQEENIICRAIIQFRVQYKTSATDPYST